MLLHKIEPAKNGHRNNWNHEQKRQYPYDDTLSPSSFHVLIRENVTDGHPEDGPKTNPEGIVHVELVVEVVDKTGGYFRKGN